MAKRTSSSMEVLLGLLTIEPMSGYDLGQMIRTSIGHFWNESYGQIYPNLKRLAAAGLVTSRAEKQKGKPDRQVYTITKKGRERLANWLAVEPQPEIPRNELLLKLFFGAQASPEILRGYLEQMLERERPLLQKFHEIEHQIDANRQYSGAPFWKIVARFGHIELEAHVRWAEEALAELRKLNRTRRSPSSSRLERPHAGK